MFLYEIVSWYLGISSHLIPLCNAYFIYNLIKSCIIENLRRLLREAGKQDLNNLPKLEVQYRCFLM